MHVGSCQKKKVENPFIGDYAPEMDEIPTLEYDLSYWDQSLIGVLRCMMEIYDCS